MATNDDERNIFDPTGVLRGMQAAGIEAWTAAVLRVMASEEYARVNSALLDSYMASSAPFRASVEALMLQFVQSDAYATAMRALLDSYMAGPLRQALEATLRQSLAGLAESRGLPASFAGWLDPLGVLPAMRGAAIEGWAAAAPPASMQHAIEQGMTQVLTQLNMPSRTDVNSISDRLGQIEQRLDAIEQRLDVPKPSPAPKPAPKRKRAG